MVIDLSPADSLFGVNSQALIDEIFCLFGDVYSRKIGSVLFDLLQDIIVVHTHVGILSVKKLVEDNTYRPNISLEPIRLFFQEFGSHSQTRSQDSLRE